MACGHLTVDQAGDHGVRGQAVGATERLLDATPLRSETGKLTVSELITESALRRDIVYEHPQLIDTFKARAKARDAKPAALTAPAADRDELRGQLAAAREELAREQRTASTCAKSSPSYPSNSTRQGKKSLPSAT
jgi:regulator of protease activity HflC (stomatin/prohibitin superfamily)